MEQKILAPQVGESITEVRILKWSKANGEAVKTGEIVVEIETDKATVEVVAPVDGALKITKGDGELVKVGEVIGSVDDAVAGTKSAAPTSKAASATATAAAPAKPAPSAPASHGGYTPSTSPAFLAGPAARKIAEEKGVSLDGATGTGKDNRVTKGDLTSGGVNWFAAPAAPAPAAAAPVANAAPTPKVADRPGDRRVPMTRIRLKIAERLVHAQHTAAILTTFNEVDMTAVMDLRKKHKDKFKEKNGVALSFMSFFTRASVLALKTLPSVNASIDGNEVVYHDYFDVGIAVGTERGLVVPVLRNVEKMTFVDIEKAIGALAVKARDGKLSIGDMSGGTFTISNGGTYGSLLSTPILNPPQSGILGMHKIQERPVAIDGKVVVRPMMYLALSYDHRLIDGKEAVTFLVTLKDHLEKPESLGLDWL